MYDLFGIYDSKSSNVLVSLSNHLHPSGETDKLTHRILSQKYIIPKIHTEKPKRTWEEIP